MVTRRYLCRAEAQAAKRTATRFVLPRTGCRSSAGICLVGSWTLVLFYVHQHRCTSIVTKRFVFVLVRRLSAEQRDFRAARKPMPAMSGVSYFVNCGEGFDIYICCWRFHLVAMSLPPWLYGCVNTHTDALTHTRTHAQCHLYYLLARVPGVGIICSPNYSSCDLIVSFWWATSLGSRLLMRSPGVAKVKNLYCWWFSFLAWQVDTSAVQQRKHRFLLKNGDTRCDTFHFLAVYASLSLPLNRSHSHTISTFIIKKKKTPQIVVLTCRRERISSVSNYILEVSYA